MVGRSAPIAIDPLDVPGCRPSLLLENPRSNAQVGSDRLAPSQSAVGPAVRQRPRPDAEIVGGEVSHSSWCSPPRAVLKPQIGAGAHESAGHRAGVLAALENRGSGDECRL